MYPSRAFLLSEWFSYQHAFSLCSRTFPPLRFVSIPVLSLPIDSVPVIYAFVRAGLTSPLAVAVRSNTEDQDDEADDRFHLLYLYT